MTEKKNRRSLFDSMRYNWDELSGYERFEYLVSLVISVIIMLVILVALVRVGRNVFELLVIRALDPLDYSVFQTIFGMILTLFIAMEFRHTIDNVIDRTGHIVQVRSVILIALLAIARKFIVIDTKTTSAEMLAALGFVSVALGGVYWLLKVQENKAGVSAR